jgi:PAS domain S-box-containing protein
MTALSRNSMNVLSEYYDTIINHARDIVLVFDQSQRIIDCNRAALAAYGYSAEELRCMTASDLRVPQEKNTIGRDWDAAGDKSGVLFETVHCRKDGTSFPVEVSSNQIEIDGQTYRQSFVRDITQRKVSELALYRRKTRALSALSRCSRALIGAREVQSLLDQICNILVTVGGYHLAWVGKPESDEGKRVSVWAKAGTDTDYLDKISISWADTPLGRGPTGTALREARTVLAHDLRTQTNYEPWRDVATRQGFAASIALPLLVNGASLGVLTVYAEATDMFDSTEVTLLEELANNVAYGMADLQTREHAERLQDRLGESDRRFQMLIEQSPAGIYVVRHGVFVYANPHMDEIMGLGYGELIGQRAQDFVLAEDWHVVTEATERMKLIGSTGNLQVRCKRKDGVTIEIGLQNVKSHYEGAPAIIGMAQDISERSRSQAEIKQYIFKLERTTEATLQAVSAMVEKRDPYTAGHERRVGELAGAIGAEMGLSPHQIKGLRLAGFVHDLGKIAVPAELLAKPSELSEAEMALVRLHAQAGYDVLKDVEFAWPIADVILQHH